MKKNNKIYKLALLLATLIWGSSFFIVKNTVDVMPVNMLLGIRFIFAAVVLALIFRKRIKAVSKEAKAYLWRGVVIGAALYIAYLIQTVGITYTTPGKNAFLTTIYCVLVPFLFWLVDKKKPDAYNILAAVMCVAGIGLVSFDGDLSINLGDGLTLISGFFFAVHIICVSKFSQGRDVIVLTIIQFATSGLLAWIVSFATETPPAQINTETILGIGFLAIFCTAIALLLQNIGQKHCDPSSAAILLSLEAVFGVIFSMIFYGERVNLQVASGFVIIFISVVISETKLSFIRKPQHMLSKKEI